MLSSQRGVHFGVHLCSHLGLHFGVHLCSHFGLHGSHLGAGQLLGSHLGAGQHLGSHFGCSQHFGFGLQGQPQLSPHEAYTDAAIAHIDSAIENPNFFRFNFI
jgi:hypothetical protein